MSGDSSLSINQEEHLRLLNALRESEILREMATLLTSSLDLAQILRILAKRTTEVCDVERCAVWLLDEAQQLLRPAAYHLGTQRLQMNIMRAGDAAWRRSPLPLNDPVVQRLLASEDEMLIVDDLQAEPSMAFIAHKFQVRSILLIALVREGRPVGMMSLDNSQLNSVFTSAQQQLAHAIAQQATIAIDHAQLYQQAQAEHRRADALVSRAQSIYQVAKAANSGEPLPAILRIALEHLLYHLKADGGSIVLLEGESIRVMATAPEELSSTIATAPLQEPTLADMPHCVQAAREKTPIFVTIQETEGSERHWYRRLSLHNAMIVPLLVGDEIENQKLISATTPTVGSAHCIGFIFVTYAQPTYRPTQGYFAFAQDIAAQCALAIEKERILTEAHRAAALATERANTLDAVIGAMSEGILVLDLDGQITTRNATAAQFIGTTVNDREHISAFLERFPVYTLQGQPMKPEDFPLARALHGELARGERFITQRIDGSERAVEVNVVPLLDAEQQKVGFVGVFRDVTEQVRVERRLRRALDTMLHAVEAVSGVTAVKTIVYNVLEMALQTLSGGHGVLHLYCEDEDTFSPTLAMSFATETETYWFDEQAILTTEIAERYAHMRELLADGHAVLVSTSDCPYHPSHTIDSLEQNTANAGTPTLLAVPLLHNHRLLGMMTLDRMPVVQKQDEMAAQRKMRDFTVWDMALAEGIAQIAALALDEVHWQQEATTAKLSAAAMRESNAYKDEFIEITAHEFRNPISVILTYSQYLARYAKRNMDPALRKTLQEATTHIEGQAYQLEHIVNSLLEGTRLNKRQIKLDVQKLDLAELVEQIVATNRALMQDGTIHYYVVEHSHPYFVQGDAMRLTEVVGNLLQNAIKYNLPGRDIRVTMRPQLSEEGRQLVEVSVSDQGIGVPKEAQARLFERFYRAPNVEGSQTRGVGLGLYIVDELLRLHGGTIRVESSGVVGEGSCFIFTLPLVERD